MFFNKELSFYCSNLDSYIDNIKKGDLRYLSWVFCVFAENSAQHKLIAARVFSEVLNKLSIDDIYRIDRQMRDTTSMEWSINWRDLNVNSFITKEMSEDEKIAVLVFASFNPNGFIREQAIKALAGYEKSIFFILLRCNDWVSNVRKTALMLLHEQLKNASDEEIVKTLPIMEKLHRSKRCEYSDILSIMLEVFKSNDNLIEKALKSKDVRARRFCISIINKINIDDTEYLSNHIKYEQDPFLRKMIFQMLLKMDIDNVALSEYFLRDKYPANRILALYYLYDNKPSAVVDISKNMLMDKNARVRELAQKIVSQSDADFDIRKHYLNNISTNIAVSIYGLGEVGLSEDCGLIESFLSDNSATIIRASMTALMRLNSSKYIPYITELLANEHSGIVKTATILLKKNKGYDFNRVFEICSGSSDENTKIKCATLLFLSGKWKALIYILMLIGSDYEKLENLCQIQLIKWIFGYNRSYTVLSENDCLIIKSLISEKEKLLRPNIVAQILFLAK